MYIDSKTEKLRRVTPLPNRVGYTYILGSLRSTTRQAARRGTVDAVSICTNSVLTS